MQLRLLYCCRRLVTQQLVGSSSCIWRRVAQQPPCLRVLSPSWAGEVAGWHHMACYFCSSESRLGNQCQAAHWASKSSFGFWVGLILIYSHKSKVSRWFASSLAFTCFGSWLCGMWFFSWLQVYELGMHTLLRELRASVWIWFLESFKTLNCLFWETWAGSDPVYWQ